MPPAEMFSRESIQKFVPADSDLALRFVELNQAPIELQDRFDTPFEVQLIPEDVFRTVMEYPHGWWSLKNHYPQSDGVVELSRVAFDASGSQALVYLALLNPTWGSGHFYLVEKRTDRWDVVEEWEYWIS
jgi:hypothetical protein